MNELTALFAARRSAGFCLLGGYHVHGNYLLYLSQTRVEFHLAVGPGAQADGETRFRSPTA